MATKNVISIGLHPDVVNYALFPGLTKEKLTQDLKAQEEHLQKLGSARRSASSISARRPQTSHAPRFAKSNTTRS